MISHIAARSGGTYSIVKEQPVEPFAGLAGVGFGSGFPELDMIILNEIAGFVSANYFLVLRGEGISKLAGKGLRQPRCSSRSWPMATRTAL